MKLDAPQLWDEEKLLPFTRSDIVFLFGAIVQAMVEVGLTDQMEEATKHELVNRLREINHEAAQSPEMNTRSLANHMPMIAEKLWGMFESFKPKND